MKLCFFGPRIFRRLDPAANTKTGSIWQVPKTLPEANDNAKSAIKYKNGYKQVWGNYKKGSVVYTGLGNVRINPDSTATDCYDCQATDTIPTEKKKNKQ